MTAFKIKDTSLFKEESSPPKDDDSLRKINVQIHSSDLKMAQALADKRGVSRSVLVNEIIEGIVLDFLKGISLSESVLLIRVADHMNEVDALNNPEASWFSGIHQDSMFDRIHECIHNKKLFDELDEKGDRYGFMLNNLRSQKDFFNDVECCIRGAK